MSFIQSKIAGRLLTAFMLSCAALLTTPAAQAQTTFDVIGPHEYELPVDFKPFNVFVQYATVQDNDKFRDDDGDQVDGSGTQTLVGLSKYVRFWTPGFSNKIGLAYEVIVPEIGVRDSGNAGYAGGIGDPLTGFAVWYKPSAGSVFGFQSFLQIPVGASNISDTNWKNLSSLLWYLSLPAKIGWTGDAGTVYQSERTNGFEPGLTLHTNNRIGLRVASWLEPFIGLDYETTDANDGAPKSHAFDGGLGLMFHTFSNQSIAVRWSTTLEGENHSDNNSLNVKYAYVW